MARRERPPTTTRSEHWMRVAVNEGTEHLNEQIRAAFGWSAQESIGWQSPLDCDGYAEYYDEDFLDRLGVSNLRVPLREFWPKSGPRWDGLARTASNKLIVVEAKAYPEEAVDFGTRARGKSRELIMTSLEDAKIAFGASAAADWMAPFYQYANRLAHLHFLVQKNQLDAYLVFLLFANAPDVPTSCSPEQWRGATRIVRKCLGIPSRHRYSNRVESVVIDTKRLLPASPLAVSPTNR